MRLLSPARSLVIAFFAPIVALAQTNTFPSSGNVGIGTTSPARPLAVTKDGTNEIGSTFRGVANFLNGDSSKGLYVGYDSSEQLASLLPQGANSGISFWSHDGSWAERMRISTNGNVGIGTTNPGTNRLHISYGASGGVAYNAGGLVVESSGRSSIQLLSPNFGDAYLFFGDASSANKGYVGQTGSSASPANVMHYYSAGSHAFSGGNVGIGTTTPQSRLSVVNTSGVTLQVDKPTGASIQFSRSGTDGYQIDDNLGAMRWLSSGGTERMRIDASGNLGIGTTNPTQKLAVNGTIQAKEVVVQTGWSDHVFRPDYPLASLSEVEGAIKRDGHLPGIPSAKEVAEHGVTLGEMQAKLLAKIEELTLHQIEQEKRFNEAYGRLQKLETENAALRASRP